MASEKQVGNVSLAPNQMLVEPEWLNENLNAPNIRIFETTSKIDYKADLGKFVSSSNRARYEQGHISGAAFLDLYDELSDRSKPGMFPLPTVSQFETIMSKNGVGPGTVVVVYSAVRPSWATRVWWLLKYHGFDQVVVLNGGWEKWQKLGFPVDKTVRSYPEAIFKADLRPDLLANKDDVIKAMNGSAVLVNALSKAQFDGTDPTHFGRPGHIPNSQNLPFPSLLEEDMATFRSPTEIKAITSKFSKEKVIAYCGGGIGASALAFAMELAGHDPVTLYAGSMDEWSSDPSLPVSKSADP